MSKFYEPVENEGDIKNDSDLRVAIHNKTRRAWDLFAKLTNENGELYMIVTLRRGEQAFNDYPDKGKMRDFYITLDAFRCLITNNLCVLLGQRKNDKLSIWHNKEKYNTALIDDFYTKHEKELQSLFTARDKVYAHIDTNVTESAFLHEDSFLRICVHFLMDLLLIEGAKDE